MVMKTPTISAAKFKAECLALLDRVARTGRGLVVTKRGRPVARVVPLEEPHRALEGSLVKERDIVSPIDEPWGAG